MGLLRILIRLFVRKRRPSRPRHHEPFVVITTQAPSRAPTSSPPAPTVLRGRCWVVDGDTIVIDNTHIRLAGIDAPELDHPYGKQAKRGGAVCLNSFGRLVKWISASIMPPPSLVSAR